jgi:hypothetical protein
MVSVTEPDFLADTAAEYAGQQMSGEKLLTSGPCSQERAAPAWNAASLALGLAIGNAPDIVDGVVVGPGRTERILAYFALGQERNLHRFTDNEARLGLITFATPGEDVASLDTRHARFVAHVVGQQTKHARRKEQQARRKEWEESKRRLGPLVERDVEHSPEVTSRVTVLAQVSAELLQVRQTRRQVAGEIDARMVPVHLSGPAGRLHLERDARREARVRLAGDRSEDERLAGQVGESNQALVATARAAEAEAARVAEVLASTLARQAAELPEEALPGEVRALRSKLAELDDRIGALSAREVQVREELVGVRADLNDRQLHGAMRTARSVL